MKLFVCVCLLLMVLLSIFGFSRRFLADWLERGFWDAFIYCACILLMVLLSIFGFSWPFLVGWSEHNFWYGQQFVSVAAMIGVALWFRNERRKKCKQSDKQDGEQDGC